MGKARRRTARARPKKSPGRRGSGAALAVPGDLASLLDQGERLPEVLAELLSREDLGLGDRAGLGKTLLEGIRQVAPDRQEAIADAFVARAGSGEGRIRTRALLLWLAAQQLGSAEAHATLIEIIAEDHQAPERHHGALIDHVFQGNSQGFPTTRRVLGARRRVLDRVVERLRRLVPLPEAAEHRSERVAIVCGQLLRPGHAPTKTVLTHAKALREVRRELELRIFVSDFLRFEPDEHLLPGQASSGRSFDAAASHAEWLDEVGVRVIYADTYQPRPRRYGKLLKSIHAFAPGVVLCMGCAYDPFRHLLQDAYPIADWSTGGIVHGDPADVHLRAYDPEAIARALDELEVPADERSRYRAVRPALHFDPPAREWTRAGSGFGEADRVFVTVGNRLETDVDVDFVEAMLAVLRRLPDARWLLVGTSGLPSIDDRADDLRERIHYLRYEPDLAGLYALADVYVNPRRAGGGWSAALAMHRGVPAIAVRGSRDVLSYLGEEAGLPDVDALGAELERLLTDDAARRALGRAQQERIAPFGDPAPTALEIADGLDEARRRFARRLEGLESL
ncbi:MAG TPA: glycosyltransferase [Polyangiaceae bacterium LLY-WYZ-14_1]|nr:glycosyltransferase [Polyangiaceae bacterium LLY-WYZ-14_1]